MPLPAQNYYNTRHNSFYAYMIMALLPFKCNRQELTIGMLPVLWFRGRENSQRAYSWEHFLLGSLPLLTCSYAAACATAKSSQISNTGYISSLVIIAEIPSIVLRKGCYSLDCSSPNMTEAPFNSPQHIRDQTVTLQKTWG